MKKHTLGGERIGAGGKMTFDSKTFNRSTHRLNEIFRSTMSGGTIVPCLVLPALPGDTFDIDIDMSILTLPTIGPLFGSWTADVHVYQTPMRLYNRDLQMNKLNIGRDIKNIQFPQMQLIANDISIGIDNDHTEETPWGGKEIANSQIEPSTILSYLGIKGLGNSGDPDNYKVTRRFNAEPWLIYWDIVKQYYTNKQEENGYYIHNTLEKQTDLTTGGQILTNETITPFGINTPVDVNPSGLITIILEFTSYEKYNRWNEDKITVKGIADSPLQDNFDWTGEDLIIQRNDSQLKIYYTSKKSFIGLGGYEITVGSSLTYDYIKPNLNTYLLKNIDDMRNLIMAKDGNTPMVISYSSSPDALEPYSSMFKTASSNPQIFDITSLQCKQEGLALRTYKSDINNNWLNTEWIDGENGVNAVTAITTDVAGTFTLDQFNIKKKVYDMLNHINASGGTYDDWQEISYGVERMKQISSPVFEGGLRKELVFQEVINQSASNANGNTQPLGTLAGRGVLGNKHKGGKLVIKCNEPSYVMAMVSIIPNIDYSTGNEWYNNLENMSELHNPYLDAIGYQDLITDTIAFWDTVIGEDGEVIYKSAGKQPAWINYQTSKNKVFGNFALQNEQMFMVLVRRYEVDRTGLGTIFVSDVTTYIDPTKFNHIFADTSPDAMNFWVQIGFDITARRVMSANQIPNL